MTTERDAWIGQRLARARKQAGLTVRQLAERLGWSDHSRLTNYEVGRRSVSVAVLIEVAAALSQPAAAFFAASDEEARIIRQVAGNRERAQQLLYLSDMLDEPEPPSPDDAPSL
jgi:transcriptional regulator with XRE-family HTH domain